ncbi:MAG: ABC transporter substrate-binding protein [Treponema sp.]|nr:ABC transporter substrate-binding protein [Treponema sp.]
MRIIVINVLLAVLLLSIGGCSRKDRVTSDKVYFAWVGPLTGSARQYGLTQMMAVEIALEDINAAGGILDGREVVVNFYDDQNDADEAVIIANRIVRARRYSAVIGHFASTPSMAAAPVYNEAELIMYSPTASHADFSSLGGYIFRNTPTQALETTAYAEFVFNNLDIKTVGILNVHDDWGNNITSIFTDTFEALGGTIILSESFQIDETRDFTPMITRMMHENPQAFFPVAYSSESARIIIQMNSLQYRPELVILTSSALGQQLLDITGEMANGAFLMSAFTPDIQGDDFARVMQAYREKTGGREGDHFLMQTYDVVRQLAEVINQANSADSRVMRPVLAAMSNYPALAGPYGMNDAGDAIRRLQPIFIEDRRFVNVSDRY